MLEITSGGLDLLEKCRFHLLTLEVEEISFLCYYAQIFKPIFYSISSVYAEVYKNPTKAPRQSVYIEVDPCYVLFYTVQIY